MKRPFLALLACMAMLLPGLVSSAQVTDLYEIEVPVESQGEEARHAGLVAALEGVLVKISGASDVAAEPSLEEERRAPERYVDQFRFVTRGSGEAVEHALWVRFDGQALERLLRDKRLLVWGRERPAVVAWIAFEEKGRRTLLGASDPGAAVPALQSAASRRGLPLRLPLMDLEDRRRIQPGDVWAGFSETIRTASLRYRPQAVLTGALTRDSDTQWRARWTLYSDGAVVREWKVVGTQEQAINYGVNLATDELARLFAAPVGRSDGNGPLMVRVANIRTLEAFMRVESHLRGLGGVTAVQPAEVTGDEVIFSVSFQGAAQGLARAIAASDTLAPARDAMPAELSYRLLK